MSENLQTKFLSRAWHLWKSHSSSENAPTREQVLLKYGIALFTVVANPVYFFSLVRALRYANWFLNADWIVVVLQPEFVAFITLLALRICEFIYLSVQVQNDLDAVSISSDNQFMHIYIYIYKNSSRWCQCMFFPSVAQLCHVIVLLFCCLYLCGIWFAPLIYQFKFHP